MKIHLSGIGLILNIIGVLLLWRFGLPPEVRRDGHGTYLRPNPDLAEVRKGKRYDLISRIGISLVIIGLVLQTISNYYPEQD